MKKNIFGLWLYKLVRPYFEKDFFETHAYFNEKLSDIKSHWGKKIIEALKDRNNKQRELDEISALQKRDIRQYVLERSESYHGFLNVETLFDERGVVFTHGAVNEKPEIVVIYPQLKTFYTQDELVVLAENLHKYLEKNDKIKSLNNIHNGIINN